MPRTSNIPKLRRHKARGLGVVTLNGHDHYFGKWPSDQVKPPTEVKEAYDRLIGVWLANGRMLLPGGSSSQSVNPPIHPTLARTAPSAPPPLPALTVTELLVCYVRWADDYYKHRDGTPTGEIVYVREALKPLRVLFGSADATTFTASNLRAVQAHLVQEGKLCRGTINGRVARIKRLFKWAVSHDLVPASVHVALATVPGLKAGRTAAKEASQVVPVPVADVEKTLAHLNAHVGAMVRVQLYSGCRTGEVLRLREMDIDRKGPVWAYRPQQHKNTYRGHDRVVYLGPKAQEVLLPFLPACCPLCGLCDRRNKLGWRGTLCGPCADLADEKGIEGPFPAALLTEEWTTRYVFRPKDEQEDRYSVLRAGRKSKVQPSQQCRKKKRPKRQPGEKYNRGSYRQAIVRGCKLAGVVLWTPLQLRHTAATHIRKKHGIEVACVVLGHTNVETSQIYAERDLSAAARIAAEMG